MQYIRLYGAAVLLLSMSVGVLADTSKQLHEKEVASVDTQKALEAAQLQLSAAEKLLEETKQALKKAEDAVKHKYDLNRPRVSQESRKAFLKTLAPMPGIAYATYHHTHQRRGARSRNCCNRRHVQGRRITGHSYSRRCSRRG